MPPTRDKYVTYQWFVGILIVLITALFGFGAAVYYPNSDGCALEQKVDNLKEGQTEIKSLINDLRKDLRK